MFFKRKQKPKEDAPRSGMLARLRGILLAFLALLAGVTTLTVWGQGDGLLSLRREPTQSYIPELAGRRVGLVAGHWGNDSGAVCPDGLTEQSVNQTVAEQTAERLRQAGLQVDVLQEFDTRLAGYQADAFVSIHADSCIGLSGFKVARVTASAVPEAEDRLVGCIWQHYAEVTGLPRHENTITHDMTDYHAFWEIAPQTPAAIIEVGFLGGNRALLEKRPARVARGVADGILCFLQEADQP